MIAQAEQANLQTMCWFFTGLPIRYNLVIIWTSSSPTMNCTLNRRGGGDEIGG
jgi:hypothetical protein